jgi:hypothetical protein
VMDAIDEKTSEAPWTLDKSLFQNDDLYTGGYHGIDTGSGHLTGFISDEHARLIAAAPELLEALRDMVSDHADLSEATLQFARAAIAKATGAST